MTFSVLTLNIWNYEGPWKDRLPLIRACIESLEPDLIALQEVLVRSIAAASDGARATTRNRRHGLEADDWLCFDIVFIQGGRGLVWTNVVRSSC